jgi:hypothetical protein
MALAGLCRHGDPAPGRVVPYGIVHEVGRQSLGEAGATEDGGGVQAGGDFQSEAVRLGLAGQQGLIGHGCQVERFSPFQAALAQRQGEERFDQPFLLRP